jgi:hypothetical protein
MRTADKLVSSYREPAEVGAFDRDLCSAAGGEHGRVHLLQDRSGVGEENAANNNTEQKRNSELKEWLQRMTR